MQKNLKRPKFITFEGLDGVGKSTQLTLFAMKLTELKEDLITSKEPGGTALGQKIRQMLLSKEEHLSHETELFLFLADRSHHVENVVRPNLALGKHVLVDRYIDSTIAYQHHFSVNELDRLNSLATKHLLPDITFYYDFDPTKLIARMSMRGGEKDRIESRSIDFMHAVRERFLHLHNSHSDRIILIDASRSIEEVAKETYERFKEFTREAG